MSSCTNLSKIEYFPIEGEKICVTNTCYFSTDYDFVPIIAAEFYGILRNSKNKIKKILWKKIDDKNYFEIDYNNFSDKDNFVLLNSEFDKFLTYFCNIYDQKIDWQEHGF